MACGSQPKAANWGISDSRKRISRDRLEPYIRLTRDANLTMIRNWCGQSTEEVLYELCDEYGILVWNDFWDSTQDHSLEPADPALFLANARDTLLRFRNHPSIVLWCGENEGVPNPVRNEGLDSLIRELDGTRYYSPNSRRVNLQLSGPWKHGEPIDFFTSRGKGFSTELGLPSVPTLDALRAMLPEADRWPPNDTWAYHDWHSDANGDVKTFMASMEEQFGAPSGLEDFERKAQLMNYADHRAMFEGFNAGLWNPNTGRLMWMSHPAWPSMNWQVYSSDYDTHGAYYGVRKACEPVHVQLNLPGFEAAVINNTDHPLADLALRARLYSIDGRLLSDRTTTLNAAANAPTTGPTLDIKGPVFVKLALRDAQGALLSDNFYWQTGPRDLNQLSPADVAIAATRKGSITRVTLTNQGSQVAVMNNVTLRDAASGSRVLPAYATDNYVSLVPGEIRTISIESGAGAADHLEVTLSGWNVKPARVKVVASK